MASEAILEARDISLALRGNQILSHVTVSLDAGQILTLIGPNGAGKTSLVKIVLGLLNPDSGTVRLESGIRLGYVPQRLTIDETLPLTVQRFVTLGTAANRAAVMEALIETGAGHTIDHAIQSISGGEFQRVLLTRALLRRPKLLVLDEPAQAVDVSGQIELYQLIQDIRDRYGCAVLMVSHDLHLVMASADQVICLNQHVCCMGHPESVSQDPAYLELFGRGATSQLALYRHHHNHQHDLHGGVIKTADGSDEHG